MIRTIIIDDEQHCIDRLSGLVRDHCSEYLDFSGAFLSAEDGIAAIKKLKPSLVFLDVQINEKTGFDVLRKLDTIDFEVIFTTAYEKYAVQAFKFSAIDYLLKPIDSSDLLQAVVKLNKKMAKDEIANKFDVLFHNLKDIHGTSKRIGVPTVKGLTFLQVSDIIHCQSDINYTTIFLKEKQKLTVAKTLKEFEELLMEYNFFRVHNSHLINLSYVKSYNKGKGGFVTMMDNTDIEVSTRRKEDLLKRLSRI